ncbi:DNA-directed RNA polymerase [Asaia prunellae]|uniref:DNA-directed RNA polymerase n=1 Tax=Asaia prunellae TaxID=610245 RepID=UPI000AE462BA
MVRGKSSATYRLSAEYLQHMGIENTQLETLRPRLLPMLIPPLPWQVQETGHNQTGGFLTQRINLLRAEVYTHSAGGAGTVSELDIRALNRVQATAWQVNPKVFEVMLEAAQTGIKLPSIPLETDEEVGFQSKYPGWNAFVERFHTEGRKARLLPDAEWEALSPSAKTDVKRDILAFHEGAASMLGKRYALSEALTTASELLDIVEFYYPFNRDFRGRIYPMTLTEMQPQGSDYAKALLRFSKGKVLGTSGLRWLLIHIANCAGEDKLSLEDRVKWSLDNLEGIMGSAESV